MIHRRRARGVGRKEAAKNAGGCVTGQGGKEGRQHEGARGRKMSCDACSCAGMRWEGGDRVCMHAYEGRLHLPLRAARAGSRVRPVDLVRLAHHHVGTALPGVRVGELGISRVVVVAPVAQARVRTRQLATSARVTTVGRAAVDGALAVPVELSHGEVLSAQVPVDVDRAEVGLVVRGGDGHAIARIKQALVAPGHVGAGLLEHLNDVVLHAVHVREVVVAGARTCGLLPRARVDGRVDWGVALEGIVAGEGDDDGDAGDRQTANGPTGHLADRLGGRRLDLAVDVIGRGQAHKRDDEDERRGDVANNGEGEAVRVVEVVRQLDR